MEKLANLTAHWLQTNMDLDQDKTEVVEYALISLILLLITFIFLIIFGWVFGVLKEGLVGALTIAFVRMTTGGAHLTSPWRCAILSALIPAGFGYLSQHFGSLIPYEGQVSLLIIVFVWGLFTILRYAPVDSEEKPIRPERKGIYRKIGMGVTVVWAMLMFIWLPLKLNSYVLTSTLSYAWQIMTLTPLGFLIYKQITLVGLKEEKE